MFALIEQPRYGWGERPGRDPPDRRRRAARGLRALGAPQPAADDAPAAVRVSQLHRRQPHDAQPVRRARGGDVLPHPVHPAGRRLHADPGRVVAAADHDPRVPAVPALRCAGRPDRAAHLHGRRPDRRRGRVAAAGQDGRGRQLLDPDPPRHLDLRPRARGHGRAADGDGARVGRARPLRRGQRHQQRGRADRRPARDRRAGCRRLRSLCHPRSTRGSRTRRSRRRRRRPSQRAKTKPLVTTVTGVSGSQRAEIETALVNASVYSFRLGIGIGAGLAILGGLLALVGIQNPRREVRCADCPGGALSPAPAATAATRGEHVGAPPQPEPAISPG